MTIMKVAAVQMRSGTSPERNAADMERMVREAVRQGAAYVQTPEVTGAMVRDEEARAAAFTSEDKDLVVATARRLARELGILVHIGSTAILRQSAPSSSATMRGMSVLMPCPISSCGTATVTTPSVASLIQASKATSLRPGESGSGKLRGRSR